MNADAGSFSPLREKVAREAGRMRGSAISGEVAPLAGLRPGPPAPWAPSPVEGRGFLGYAASFRITCATVEPNSPGLGATVRPYERMISAFSAALSPVAEMIAPA